MDNLGSRIAERRLALGLTQARVAELTGVSVPYISQIENGVRSGSWDVRCAIADALGMTMDEFRALAEESPPEPSQPTEAA